MEFIPLERSEKKVRKRPREEPHDAETEKKKNKNIVQNDEGKNIAGKKPKQVPTTKVIQKKNVKNKYRETLVSKKTDRVSRKKNVKKVLQNKKGEEEDDAENEDDVEDEEDDAKKAEHDAENEEDETETETEEDANDEEENEDDSENEEEEEKDSEAEAFKKKCKALDEKKKNRLFVKFPKKIYSEAQIKELHPEIRSVIFPRKKKSRWCWAVFASEEKADAALKKLKKNKTVVVSKPNPHEATILKLKQKMRTVLKRKEARNKLQKMWM